VVITVTYGFTVRRRAVWRMVMIAAVVERLDLYANWSEKDRLVMVCESQGGCAA